MICLYLFAICFLVPTEVEGSSSTPVLVVSRWFRSISTTNNDNVSHGWPAGSWDEDAFSATYLYILLHFYHILPHFTTFCFISLHSLNCHPRFLNPKKSSRDSRFPCLMSGRVERGYSVDLMESMELRNCAMGFFWLISWESKGTPPYATPPRK